MNKKISKIILLGIATIGLLSACGKDGGSAKSEAENWPKRPMEVVLHASAGGDTDFNARTFGEFFEKETKKPFVVTNMPGASGLAATENIKATKPDGYKALFTHSGPMVVNYVSGVAEYDFKEFDVSCIPAVDSGTVLVASKQSGIKSLNDLVEKSKAAPQSIIYGTEFGGYSHLQVLMLQDKAGVELKLADIGSTADKVTNLLGGRIDVASIAYGSVKDYVKNGDMIALAQYNEVRNQNLADIPTAKEQGVDMVMDNPYIIAFPKGTDPAIVQKMSEVAVKIGQNSEYAEKLKNGFSQEVRVLNTQEAKEYLQKIEDTYLQYKDQLRNSTK